MGNFTVKPENLATAAENLQSEVAPAYGTAASTLRTEGAVDAPGFGIALAFLDAMYRSRLDFMALDLDGAKDAADDIAAALTQTAQQYQASEDLNISGFGGPGTASETFGSSIGGSLLNTLPGTAGGLAGIGAVGLAITYGTSANIAACAALCPSFIPAAIAIPLFIANIPSIFEAAGALKAQADNLTGAINIALAQTLGHAADGWEGEGALGFGEMTTKLTSHLDKLAGFVDAVGEVLTSVGITLSILWSALVIFAVAFLAWLIYMHAASIGPQVAAVQAIIQSVGLAASSTWMTGLMATLGVATAGSAVLGIVTGDLKTFLNPPDAGTQGTPDLQEFRVDANFDVPL